ncbi:efflux RND transporter periplasmic adaptor subunit [Dechloromonas sp. A34]|uniref:efflux RND transporter periplasmic adaptor subunit n=1 Tax=Dechloromonas sp. A34 TaxID=447588 RepID=UPI00224968B0|nr:efflux RND transporter periplasmic adaptor subunit [Dechloromonas sp. A34]
MSKTTPFPITLLCGLALLFAGCQGEAPPPLASRAVLVQAVAPLAVGTATYTGEIRARHELDLAFRVGGKLAARLVDAGAEIKPGQPLARLDPADLELAATAARAQLAGAESDLATASAERERYAGLLAKKFVSQAAFEAKDNAANSARARLEQARSQSRISGNQAAYGTLSSEFPAVVTAVLADAGQVVSAGQAVFRLARPEEKEVAIAVAESRIAELKAAKALSVGLWANPEVRLRGELRELSPAADPATRTYAARIRLLDPPPEVRLGMTARVFLDAAGEAALLVPLAAVVDQGNGPLVWVVAEGKANPRPIRLSRFQEDGAVVAAGLQAGELVVVAGAARLVVGQAVDARPVTPPAGQR